MRPERRQCRIPIEILGISAHFGSCGRADGDPYVYNLNAMNETDEMTRLDAAFLDAYEGSTGEKFPGTPLT